MTESAIDVGHDLPLERSMPLVRIDSVEGRSDREIKDLLEASHRAIVKAFHVNERDRCQIYCEHKSEQIVVEDTGLEISRTDKVIIFTVFSKARETALKVSLYKLLSDKLAVSCSISPSDVVITIVENTGADWNFGNGEAQFFTEKLRA